MNRRVLGLLVVGLLLTFGPKTTQKTSVTTTQQLPVTVSTGSNNETTDSPAETTPAEIVSDTPIVTATSDNQPFTVLRVVDGDTIHALINGKDESIRLVGIDAPEIAHTPKPADCYGDEAKSYLNSLLTGKVVTLEADTLQGDRDKYGRLLRFIFLPDGSSVQELLLKNGYVFENLYTKTPHIYRDQFVTAQSYAQTSKLGVWGVCGGKKQ